MVYYDAELTYLRKVANRMHLQTLLLHNGQLPEEWPDLGLRSFLGRKMADVKDLQSVNTWIKDRTVYCLKDTYLCNYIFLLLPEEVSPTLLLIGPYTDFRITQQHLMEEAERFGLHPSQLGGLEQYYKNIPYIPDDGPLFIFIHVFAEHLWKDYEVEYIDQTLLPVDPDSREHPGMNVQEEQNLQLQMKVMEARYAHENELMRIVSQGLVHKAETILNRDAFLFFEQRTPDALRNQKNYCIVCNTLMRKAAEQGGVHPYYLDKQSSAFAREIEAIGNVSEGQELLTRMIVSYCRLVKSHSFKGYSSPIQKVMTHIDANLSCDLTLNTLATTHNLNPSYLSALFRKETGQTVTNYVNQKRMDHAMHLLRTTKLQIQTIALHCGISDVNYFSKIFKKHTGKTPGIYRKERSTIL